MDRTIDEGGSLTAAEWAERIARRQPPVAEIYARVRQSTCLSAVSADTARAYTVIAASLERGGTLFLAGNGGSMADALHISGEMQKSFKLQRPIPEALRQRLSDLEFGDELSTGLQQGLSAHVLGVNAALSSAVGNDIRVTGIGFAQELLSLARPGDVFLGISTSGNAKNVRMAASLARAMGLSVIALTGRAPNPLADAADISLAIREAETYKVQEAHLQLYHQLCLMLEQHFYGGSS